MRYALRRIDQAVRKYAASVGWQPGDYNLYVRWNDTPLVLSIGLVLEARSFPRGTDFEQWDEIYTFLRRELKDEPELRSAVGLVIQTFDQTAAGGGREIPATYDRIEDLIGPPAAV